MKRIAALAIAGLLVPLTIVGASVAQPVDAHPTPAKPAAVAPAPANFDAEAKMLLASFGYSVGTPERYTKAVKVWQQTNNIWNKSCQCYDGEVGPITIKSLRDAAPQAPQSSVSAKKAQTTQPSPRPRQAPPASNPAPVVPDSGQSSADPPQTDPNPGIGRLPVKSPEACADMSGYRQAAGLPDVFDHFGFREGGCVNDQVSRNGCCVGYWQINTGNFTAPGYRDGIAACGVSRRSDILGNSDAQKRNQACVAKVLYDVSGLSPWHL